MGARVVLAVFVIIIMAVNLRVALTISRPIDKGGLHAGLFHLVKEPPVRPMESFDPFKGFGAVNETIMDDAMIRRHRQFYNIPQDKRTVFIITPTHYRATQMVDMIRMAQTLKHDKAIYWLVIEDADRPSARIRDLLERTGLPFAHMAADSIRDIDGKKQTHRRGLNQRNRGLDVVESLTIEGIVYFGDDDNTYDIRLFDQLRQTKRVGVTAVGLMSTTGWAYERCRVDNKTGRVVELLSLAGRRKYKLDMAAFCFTTELFREKKPRFQQGKLRGSLETEIVEALVSSMAELEALDDCQRIFVWHTRSRGTTKEVPKDSIMYNKLLPTI